MTASELYKIVCDVPREAWPDLTYTCGDLWIDTDGLYPGKLSIIESAFVGSMTAWLASLNWFPKSHIWRDGARVMLSDGSTHKAGSLVAALAAACKEACKEVN
jgi:hypothetical protein